MLAFSSQTLTAAPAAREGRHALGVRTCRIGQGGSMHLSYAESVLKCLMMCAFAHVGVPAVPAVLD